MTDWHEIAQEMAAGLGAVLADDDRHDVLDDTDGVTAEDKLAWLREDLAELATRYQHEIWLGEISERRAS